MSHGDKKKQARRKKREQYMGTGKPAHGKCAMCGQRNPIDGQPCPNSSAGMPHLVID